jgi:hypothetical protein
MSTFDRIAVLVGLISGLLGIYQFSQQQVWFWYVIPGILALAVFLPFARPLLTIWRLRRLLRDVEEFLNRHSIRPDRIITFDRSSAIFGGMLAQRMGVSELLSLPRSAKANEGELAPREISVGRRIQLQYSEGELSNALVFVFHLRTGSTFESGLKALTPDDGPFSGWTMSLFATEGAKAKFPGVLNFRSVRDGEDPNANFPWISGKYIHK